MKESSFLIGLLQIMFVGLKLTGHINWPWWWVMSPAWSSLALSIIILIAAIVSMSIKAKKKDKEQTISKWQQKIQEVQNRQTK